MVSIFFDPIHQMSTSGIICKNSSPIIINCTFADNSSSTGNALVCYSRNNLTPSDLRLTNCILWDGGDEIYNYDNSTITLKYCDIQGSWLNEGNIDIDPQFVDPCNNDYHLLPSSPCIDTGDPYYVSEPNETDLDGNPRVINSRIDMGAYEFNHIPVADAGPNTIVYAGLDGTAQATLDGNGSYDDDGQPLTYLWTWTIDSNDYDANGLTPTIQLPVGEHTIQLFVNDGIVDSEPDEVTITVIAPIQAHLWLLPLTINRQSKTKRVMAWMHLPEGITKDQIDQTTPLLLYPGSLEPINQYIFEHGQKGSKLTSIFIIYDKAELMAVVPDNGLVDVQVVGMLTTGRYFYGTDFITIIGREHPHQMRLRKNQ